MAGHRRSGSCYRRSGSCYRAGGVRRLLILPGRAERLPEFGGEDRGDSSQHVGTIQAVSQIAAELAGDQVVEASDSAETPSSGPREWPVLAMTERAGAAVERAVERHHRLWGAPELMSRAPGRVNLIGDHTDHNDGFVLPMAIPLDTAIAVSRNPRGVDSEVVSEGFGRAVLGPRQTRSDPSDWAAHMRGVSRLLAEQGVRPEPWRASIATDVPIGAGLSSSAAMEVAACQVLLRLSGVEWSAAEIARLGQRVENEILGLPSGIMDQLVSASAVAGHALMIDCRSLQSKPFAVSSGSTVVIMDTNTCRPLVGSAYAERRENCERVAAALGVQALRDADLPDLDRLPDALVTERRRARHVITENRRTLDAARAMARGDGVLALSESRDWR